MQVNFPKPLIPVIINGMKFRVDLHVHSKFSGDNDSEAEESVLQAIKLNLDGIAFTEHSYYSASEPVEKLREKYRDWIRIFRGVEYSSAEGHCLIFGLDTDKLLPGHLPVEEIVGIVNPAGGVVIPSHPYRGGASLGDAIKRVKGFSAIEGYNGCNMHSFNAKAVEVSMNLMLPYTGGSDAHAPEEVGACYTEFEEEVTYDNFIDLLKKGDFRGVDIRKVSRTFF